MTLEEAIKASRTRIARGIAIGKYLKQWPEDHWISISPDWDLNLWADDGVRGADLYVVKDGSTLTDTFHPVVLLKG
jgi:hypothetical protein